MTKQQGIGTYLAQGWAANATLAYLMLLGFVLVRPSREDWPVWLILVPIYFSIYGIIGAAVAILIWIVDYARGRRTNILYRAAAAILIPVLLITTIAALGGFLNEMMVLFWVAASLVILVLPPALLSGTRLNPLKFLVMDLTTSLPKYGWARALSIIALPLLRLASVLGLLESLLYLACQRAPELSALNLAGNEFTGAVIAVIYFTITLSVSLWLPQKFVVLVIGVLANIPIAAFAVTAKQHAGWDYQSFAIIGWIFVSLWTLFAVSQVIRSETRRIIPVTMLEIRVRHALNYW
ncbi:MAG TPA: hypothetical protein VGJ69_11965 [Pyrinomonadaceae bacterium]|jgi:hypothetical protein